MKFCIAIATAALLPLVSFAASPWDGIWKTKLDTFKISGKPDVYEIAGGKYRCGSCAPPIVIRADGEDHKVTGHDYYDMYAARIVNDSSVELTAKLAGKDVYKTVLVVSPDHNTLTFDFTDHTGAQVVTGKAISKRVAAGKPGAHAISGSWQQESVPDMSNAGSSVILQSSADGMKSNYNGWVLDAKFDGKLHPVVGDPAHTLSTVKRIGPNEIEETDHRSGKVVDISRWTLAKDGRSISVVDKDPLHGTTATYVMTKEP